MISTVTAIPGVRLTHHHPFDPTAADLSDDVPVMVGGTRDENALFLAPDDAVWNRTLNEDELKIRVAKVAAGNTDAVLALHSQMHPGMNPAELLIEITTNSNFWVRSVLLAERKAAKGKAPVYMYSFNWRTPVLNGKLMAPHALDVPFAFDTLDVVGLTGHCPPPCPSLQRSWRPGPALPALACPITRRPRRGPPMRRPIGRQ